MEMIEGQGDGFGVRLQPMVHVADMSAALDFYKALGARLVFGSRDQDWALLDFAGTRMGLLAHPPGDGKKETVELQFTSDQPLEEVQSRMSALGAHYVQRGVADEAFGRMLKLQTSDGLLIKVVEIERDLVDGAANDAPV
jgi:catechol 2,3-dioxygenase-like lactoylglutathione lyase family enzyme